MSGVRVIAIDGPAASGKSTTAGAVARALGALHLDSGALYRALTVVALEGGSADPGALLRRAESRGLALRPSGQSIEPVLDGRSAEPLLRSSEVNARVSAVSAIPEVREWVTRQLRAVALPTGQPDPILVLDGRDIGTTVFPHAPVKVFLTATPEARARRRLLQRGGTASPEQVAREAADLAERDRQDEARAVAPLRPAADAVLLDTTDLQFAEQVRFIVALARERLSLE
jgi:cytidylate kinase